MAICGGDSDSDWGEKHDEIAAAFPFSNLSKQRERRYCVHEVNKKREKSCE
jgi:hypothetical protein